MTQEEKAEAYDRAIETAKSWYIDAQIDFKKSLETLFPELKESEDERIKEDIITYLSTVEDKELIPYETWIAWLEKQDSHYTFEIKKGHWYKCVCDYMLNGSDLIFKNDRLYYCRSDWRLGGEIDERNVKDIGVNGYKSFFRPATNQEIKDWLEKQGEQKPNNQFTPKQADILDKHIDKFLEQKPIDNVEPKFKVGDIIRHKKQGFTCKIIAVDNEYRLSDCNGTHLPIEWQDAYELVEQNPADKIEPKFNVGDCIINNDKRIAIPTHILKIEKYGYVTSRGYISFDKVKTDYHLLTIVDANG